MAETENKEKVENTEKPEEASGGYVFTKEEIKKRPLNRHKVARNTMLAALSAIVFGLVACLTFLLLAPFLMKQLNQTTTSTEVKTLVSFPEDKPEDEMDPSDMLISAPEPEIDYSRFEAMEEQQIQQIQQILSDIHFSVSDYQELYRSLSTIAFDAQKAMVRVTPVKKSTDWFDNINTSTSELSGVIVANNGSEFFIVTYSDRLKGAESILVTFANNVQTEADFIKSDKNTGLCTLGVPYDRINEATIQSIAVANLGSSTNSSLSGSPIIAIGSPSGIYGSVNYGMVTAHNQRINVTDNYYTLVSTDIYGSKNATGILINLRGDVVGIINTKFTPSDMGNLVCALGITELKKTLENLSNSVSYPYFGITGVDVPFEAFTLYDAPKGALVTSVQMDSPAMAAGLQSGDIITSFAGEPVTRFLEFVNAMRNVDTTQPVEIIAYRAAQDTYKEITLEAILVTEEE
ncbi:MAG: S1C family serine protease [Lachnospiraceae bacterium]|nr:S1C family serine protease [Lachnospiraceae bacterium]